MWYLMEEQPDATPSARYWLGGVSGPGRSIGRKHVDIQLRASSVSRAHARLTVIKGPFYNHPHPVRNTTAVTVFDSSAYGTFLKYPDGHTVHRSVPTHHTRLDKHTPTEISDGARLAFGAPTAWWKLVRHPMLVVSSRLTEPEVARLADVSAATALDVLSAWTAHATHLVTNTFAPTSFKHLIALAAGKPVVTPAFVEAVNHIVVNACSVATSSQTASAAEEATRLPDPALFKPPVDKADAQLGAYAVYLPPDPLDRALLDDRRKLLLHIIVAFERDDRRAKYAQIVEACGGETALIAALPATPDRRVFTVVAVPARPGDVPEAALNAAVIAARLAPLECPVVPVRAAPAQPQPEETCSSAPSPTRHGRKRPAPPSPDGTAADADDPGAKSDDAPDADCAPLDPAQSPRPPVRKRSRLAPDPTPAPEAEKPKLGAVGIGVRPPKPAALDADDDDDDDAEPARRGSAALHGSEGATGEEVADGASSPPQRATSAAAAAAPRVDNEPRYYEDDVLIIPQPRPRPLEPPARPADARDPRDVRPFRAPVLPRQPGVPVYRYTGVEDAEQEE